MKNETISHYSQNVFEMRSKRYNKRKIKKKNTHENDKFNVISYLCDG